VIDTPPSAIASLDELRAAEAKCQRCLLYRDATQVVPGEGPRHPRVMLVGEQPGHEEDLEGRPFVGPAGRLLDRAIVEAGLDRSKMFITNAVKHFKFTMRGKRRLHQKPNAYEIEQCRWWLQMELAMAKPSIILAMGTTAARSVLGRPVTISKVRGHMLAAGSSQVIVTIHPSYLLRIPDPDAKAREYRNFVADLRTCAELTKNSA
jgi:uracil-DNA glycosylase